MSDPFELRSPGRVGIFVLSEKLGESIVVTLPDGKWFVVDAFKGSDNLDDPGPVGRFIEHFALPVEDCLFVLLTHLHEDHHGGIPRLLRFLQEQGGADSAGRYHPPFATHPAYRSNAIIDEVEKIIRQQNERNDEPKAKQAKNRGRRIAPIGIAELCRKDYEDVAPWRVVHQCTVHDTTCRVFAFLPARSIEARYMTGKAAKSYLAQLADARPPKSPELDELLEKQRTIVNDMSVGLAVELGETVVLLTGDGEGEAWREADRYPGPQINPHRVDSPLFRATFLKVPHHASKRAWNPVLEGIYEGCSWVIATHHERGSYCLPTAEGLEKILDKNVIVAVPDRKLLQGIPEAWHTRPSVPVAKIPVDAGRNATAQDIEPHQGRYASGKFRVAPEDEVPWVGALLDAENTVQQWLGGTRATFLSQGAESG